MKRAVSHHEVPTGPEVIETSSDRSFGFVFAVVFLLVALYLRWYGNAWWLAPLALSPVFLGLALTRPEILHPLNRAWTWLGLAIGAIVAPIVMAIIYFGLITPLGMLARLLGKDFLRLKKAPADKTYWLARQDGNPPAERLRDQF